MNKQDIIKKLANPRLDDYERESLSQLLHYLNAEGVNNTSSNNSHSNNSRKRTSTSSNYKGKNPEGRIKDSSHIHTSSNKHTR
jgi:hypothetical protein